MSNIKNYFEELSVIVATAIFEESSNSYYCVTDNYSKTEEKIMHDIFEGNVEDVFYEMYSELTDCQWNRMHEQMPKTFAACTLLLPWLSDTFRENMDVSSHSLYFDYSNKNILESVPSDIMQMFVNVYDELEPFSFTTAEAQHEIIKNRDTLLSHEMLDFLETEMADVPESDRNQSFPCTMATIQKLHELLDA